MTSSAARCRCNAHASCADRTERSCVSTSSSQRLSNLVCFSRASGDEAHLRICDANMQHSHAVLTSTAMRILASAHESPQTCAHDATCCSITEPWLLDANPGLDFSRRSLICCAPRVLVGTRVWHVRQRVACQTESMCLSTTAPKPPTRP